MNTFGKRIKALQFSFLLRPLIFSGCFWLLLSAFGTTTLIPTGATWKYRDNGSNQGTAWRAITFDESSWAAGPAELGYGDFDEATVVSFGPNSNQKYTTTYFRHSFNVADANAFLSLTLRLIRDDGAVVYLNGTEVFRSNLPAGNITYTNFANSLLNRPAEATFVSTSVDPALLESGVNVVAVEIHQASLASPDISFELELTGDDSGNADDDGDGFTNQQELLAGTDAQNPSDAPGIIVTEPIGADIRVSFKTVAGKKYRVEFNEDYPTGTWFLLADELSGNGVAEVLDAGGSSQPKRFYRAVVATSKNHPPVVSAGANQTVTLPTVANLNGTVSDDGWPTGILTATWSAVSGPGTVTFGDASATNTTASFSAAGDYVLRLSASDSELAVLDEALITVLPGPPTNQPPAVAAGPDQTITLPAPATLAGIVTDDGLPTGILTSIWSIVSGPGTVTFGDASATNTTASFSIAGDYVLRLSGSDGELTVVDELFITVLAEPPTNQPPVVAAGPDQTVTLPAPATLAGTVTDDGLPTGTLTATWSTVSGPGTVTFDDASAVNTTASFVLAGDYVLRLAASDSALSAQDELTITVLPTPNQPPTVSLISPTNGASFTELSNLTLQAMATDLEGSIAKVEFFRDGARLGEDTTSPFELDLNNLSVGNYSFTAVATDNSGASTTAAAVTVTVNPPVTFLARLGRWRFNNSANYWQGEQGELPLQANNIQSVVSFDGNGLQITNTGAVALLKYRDVESGGKTNLDCQNGSLRFWYKPYWASSECPIVCGQGPTQWARLVEMGSFAITINPAGTAVSFQTPNGSGGVTTNVTAGISFGFVQNWCEIVVTYSPSNSSIRINGNTATIGSGVSAVPPVSVQTNGFSIGSSTAGTMPARGLIDEFETFNYPFGPLEIRQNDAFLSAVVTEAPAKITLNWRDWAFYSSTVKRRLWLDPNSSWQTLATTSGWSLEDIAVTPGQRYEYTVGGRTIVAGLKSAPRESRGKVILLVDNTLANSLTAELDQFTSDLVGDGWVVQRYDVPRHNDANWSANVANIASIKSLVVNYYAANLDAKAVCIIGHVTIPYAGINNPDGHGGRPFPTDGYYGDIDSTLWTDSTVNFINPFPWWFNNVPGDGIFDQTTFPSALELGVGRVDFARLPVFANNVPAGAQPKTELQLLQQYFNKHHRYRHRQLAVAPHCVVTGLQPGTFDSYYYRNALANGSRWLGFDLGKIDHGDLFLQTTSSLWGFEVGYGGFDTIYGNGVEHTATDLVDPAQEPPIAFFTLGGSYFSDWNTDNNLLRAVLCTPNYGLGSLWSLDTQWRWEPLGLGEPMAAGLQRTCNDISQFPNGAPIYFALMGDPTLRLQVTAPPSNLTGAQTSVNEVSLTWFASTEPGTAYFVYRSTNGIAGNFLRLTSEPTNATSFTDANAPGGSKLYQVRALRLLTTGSGSFTNLSQGQFMTVN